MRRLFPLIILIGACAPEAPTIPAGQSAVCADGRACRSVTVGRTVVRGLPGQKLFTELVAADPSVFADIDTLTTALHAANVEALEPDRLTTSPQPALCPAEPADRVIEALHRDLIRGESRSPVCSPDYQARYLVTVRPDGSIACIENRFAYSCV
ncbi:MAG: hypothetical protein EON91_13395 [Brevundimonas sp.]|uniref:hypothetical protein n=1 Tax=Brevundimonas sp. TaxID=1871086 RepID=UPI001214207F|nr:hypothetical protein [Brevundimonas sp.]RZJ16413.1 MAG: hypothetical protein EON91_13395 [Brevundimonas sp.]